MCIVVCPLYAHFSSNHQKGQCQNMYKIYWPGKFGKTNDLISIFSWFCILQDWTVYRLIEITIWFYGIDCESNIDNTAELCKGVMPISYNFNMSYSHIITLCWPLIYRAGQLCQRIMISYLLAELNI